jgi:uncharacterized NAD(P)/FAD-binding protein YdhS
VIGGGFCGAFFAAQLAQYSQYPVTISVIEPRAMLGGGVAYSSTDPAHRINVPASRMTLFPENPLHFDEWFRRGGELDTDPDAIWHDGNAYPRRAAFGRYVAQIVASRRHARPGVTIAHIRDMAISVEATGAGYTIHTAQGEQIEAGIVVLATSHPPPGLPAGIAHLAEDPAVIADPWRHDALQNVRPDEDVLIIGAGLTMADVVASLSRRGHKGQITAFSRRGLLPRGHARIPAPAGFSWLASEEAPYGLLRLVRRVRAMVATAPENNLPWQAIFDDVRANGQRLWRGFDTTERRRFLRHLRVYWDAHRYRIAPQIEQILQDKQQDKSLRVLAASMRSAARHHDKIDIVLQKRRRPREPAARLCVDRVIITTGPSHGTVVDQNPALRSLAEQGHLQPDELGLGIKVDAAGQVIDANGKTNPTLLAVGPLAREQFGELMGLPQVAAQPNAVAAHIAARLGTAIPADLHYDIK